MEDTLRDFSIKNHQYKINVLILVLMEDTLRAFKLKCTVRENSVLILVLMEDTLRVLVSSRPSITLLS